MTERPILMSAPMVRATLDGSKTQTRRVLKTEPVYDGRFAGKWKLIGKNGREAAICSPMIADLCPYGQPGDRLWVREAWRTAASLDHLSPQAIADRCLDAGYRKPWAPLLYDADGHRNSEWRGFETPPKVSEPGKSRPSIHMPRWASRITLETTRVRVERLQDINEHDAAAEGVATWAPGALSPEGQSADPSDQFRWLWCSINGHDSWSANPWVWVIDFRRITP